MNQSTGFSPPPVFARIRRYVVTTIAGRFAVRDTVLERTCFGFTEEELCTLIDAAAYYLSTRGWIVRVEVEKRPPMDGRVARERVGDADG